MNIYFEKKTHEKLSVEGRYVNNCSCCQPKTLKDITVALTCADGFITQQSFQIPKSCDCLACVTEEAHNFQTEQIVYDGGIRPQDSHAALTLHKDSQVAPEDIFGVPPSLVQQSVQEPIAELSAKEELNTPIQAAPGQGGKHN